MPFKELEKFNVGIERTLLDNGFAFYDDWEHGPMDGWSEDRDHVTLRLFRHDFGYWVQFCRHAGGQNLVMNIGESNNAQSILALRDALKGCRLSRIIRQGENNG